MKKFERAVVLTLLVMILILAGCKKMPTSPGNNPPSKPSTPSGPSLGVVDTTYTFSSFTTDPDDDSISMKFDWGDGSASSWSGLVASGDTISMGHSYSSTGIYSIKAQAKDKDGATSGWSDPFQITISSGGTGWERFYGGNYEEVGKWVGQTSDGGYMIVGYTTSYGAGAADAYLVKTDASGNEIWHSTIGGSQDEWVESACKTADGGYILTGTAYSYDPYWGSDDLYLAKADANGNEIWHKYFRWGTDSTGAEEWGYSVQQTTDGGYIIAGFMNNYAQDTLSEVYLIKTDNGGNKLWSKLFGGPNRDGAYSVQQTSDGGYIIAGWTRSFGAGAQDVYLIKTDANGNETWYKTFGGPGYDGAYSVQQTSDGGYIIAGYLNSVDIYLIKTDANGNEVWSKTFGGADYEEAFSVQQTTDGGYIVAGVTASYGAGVDDVYLIKTDANGNEVWNKTFGGSNDDTGYWVQQTSDGGYIITGDRQSPPVSGSSDAYLIYYK